MFKPRVMVARIVHAEDKFSAVEETTNSKALWSQSAGHLEVDETLVQATARELWEGTGIKAQPQHFICMHQRIALNRTPSLCFLFSIELANMCATEPRDSDIDCCRWISTEKIFFAPNLRLPLVMESIRCYQSGQCHPLAVAGEFDWPFTEGARQRTMCQNMPL